ncbi:hypothetical protein MMC24_004640 [Lignoscripta atroalba]|nr:hypothetical protein [Lignoscripta atroalba]
MPLFTMGQNPPLPLIMHIHKHPLLTISRRPLITPVTLRTIKIPDTTLLVLMLTFCNMPRRSAHTIPSPTVEQTGVVAERKQHNNLDRKDTPSQHYQTRTEEGISEFTLLKKLQAPIKIISPRINLCCPIHPFSQLLVLPNASIQAFVPCSLSGNGHALSTVERRPQQSRLSWIRRTDLPSLISNMERQRVSKTQDRVDAGRLADARVMRMVSRKERNESAASREILGFVFEVLK